jgi:hypothetical protein
LTTYLAAPANIALPLNGVAPLLPVDYFLEQTKKTDKKALVKQFIFSARLR